MSILGFIGGDKADPSVDMTLYTLTIIQSVVINSSYNLSAALASKILLVLFFVRTLRRDSYYDSSPRTESSVDHSRHVKSFSDDSGGEF